MSVDELFLMEQGVSFHNFGPAITKDLCPYDLTLLDGIFQVFNETPGLAPTKGLPVGGERLYFLLWQ